MRFDRICVCIVQYFKSKCGIVSFAVSAMNASYPGRLSDMYYLT